MIQLYQTVLYTLAHTIQQLAMKGQVLVHVGDALEKVEMDQIGREKEREKRMRQRSYFLFLFYFLSFSISYFCSQYLT